MPDPQYPTLDRLIRKEVGLGTIRALEPPQGHLGLRVFAPWLDVASDDVIFDFAKGLTTGLAPARAEDAESELAQKDMIFGGEARASVIDWSLKDHYNASDVQSYSEAKLIQAQSGIQIPLPLTVGNMVTEFNSKVARDDASRRKKIDNRIEWMIMQSLSTGAINYNDGKIMFSVDWGRPTNQQAQAPGYGLWSVDTSDPIKDIKDVQDFMFDLYGIRITRAMCSKKILRNLGNSTKFLARTGLVLPGYGFTTAGATERATPTPLDMAYLNPAWDEDAARAVIERATGITFMEPYDSVYRTRPIGGTTITNNRFFPENRVIFLPDEADIAEIDDTPIGFGKTLTSPHPEGEWQPGYYEWEEKTRDPWGINRGNGVKAFPVFPHMEYTFTMDVLA